MKEVSTFHVIVLKMIHHLEYYMLSVRKLLFEKMSGLVRMKEVSTFHVIVLKMIHHLEYYMLSVRKLLFEKI